MGLQTDRPLKRGVNPFGGIRMAREACQAYGYELSEKVEEEFHYRTTHNDGVFRVYNERDPSRPALRPDHRACPTPTAGAGSSATTAGWRSTAIDRLIEEKQKDKAELGARRDDGCENHPPHRGGCTSRSTSWAS